MKRIYTPAKKKRILIVNDDQLAGHTYQEKLQRHGFNVEIVCEAHNAIAKLREATTDLMVLDLCMPGINAIELLQNIRADWDRQALPVVVFSNPYLGAQTRNASEAGANLCVPKAAMTAEKLLELISGLFLTERPNEGQPTLALPIVDPISAPAFRKRF